MTNEDPAAASDAIDMTWWADVLPASPPKFGTEDEDDVLGPVGWHTPELVSRDLRDLAGSAETGSAQQRLLEALSDACSAMLEPEDWAEPFRPFMTLKDGRRSVLPSDIGPDDLALIAKAAPLIEHLPVRARAADVAWTYGNRSDLAMLGLMLDAYLASPLERGAWHAISKDSWERAMDIMRRRGRAENSRREAAVETLLHRVLQGTISDGFMLVDLADLYRRSTSPSAETKRQLADHLASLASESSGLRLGRHLERAGQRFLISLGEDSEAHAATVRIARSYVAEADTRLASADPSEMAAGMFIEKALSVFRALPRSYKTSENLEPEVGDLERRLRQNRHATLESMTAFETDPVDLTEAVRHAEAAVAGRPAFEALVRLATIEPLQNHAKAEAEAKERLVEGGFARLFGRLTFANDGRKVATSSGATGEATQAEVWSDIVRYFGLRVGLVVNGRILPAYDVVCWEHHYDMPLLRRICWDSPTVPPAHVELWARGLWHGLKGDFLSATSVLVPQFEQLLRYHVKNAGTHTLFVDPVTGTETEKSLTALLATDAAQEILGTDLRAEVRALFVEQEGANLRNETAHGLLTDAGASSVEAIYAWWLLLRIAVVPLWVAIAEQSRAEAPEPPNEDA